MWIHRLLFGSEPERPISVLDSRPELGALMAKTGVDLLNEAGHAMLGNRPLIEIAFRQIEATESLAHEMRVSGQRLERLTLWLVGLTIVLAILTIATVLIAVA